MTAERWDHALLRRAAAGKHRALEVGCMYEPGGRESTRVIADALAPGGRLLSIDKDAAHIDACKQLIGERDNVQYAYGRSLHVLRELAAHGKYLDLAFLDGSGDPQEAFAEFMLCRSMLAPQGMVIVDDAQEMAPTDAYPAPRPHGKAGLILDWLRARRGAVPHQVAGDAHKMLVYGTLR